MTFPENLQPPSNGSSGPHERGIAARRLVVFTGNLAYSVRKGIVSIDEAIPELEWLIVIHQPSKTPRILLRNQWRNLKRNGWRWVPYQIGDVWQRVAQRGGEGWDPKGPGTEFTEASLRARRNVRIVRVDDIHGESTLDLVRKFDPELGLSLAAPILRAPLFSIPRLGTINLHKGKLPDFRGMPPAFWELWHDASSVGCTVHVVDEKLDTGPILVEGSVEREAHSTLRGLQLRLDELGCELTRRAVAQCLTNTANPKPQPTGGRLFRKPTLAQEAALARKLRSTAVGGVRPQRVAKEAVHGGVFTLSRTRALRLAPRITVLLYHRVSDAARDNLTTGVEQFDRQMALLRAHCRVLTIEEVVATERVHASDRPLVCVTFDDGYLDNYTNAAPILQRHGLPAAFFVSTGIIATGGRFDHDIRRGNAPIPVMQWDHLREMQDAGFTIGSHSVSHIDCAGAPEERVRDEMAQSRDDLMRELGLAKPIFAYPYGGRQHMTPARLELVKQAGYVACLSAYGGSNIGTVDRFNCLRRGINWEFSDRAFLYQCLGM